MASMLLAELAAKAKSQGQTLYQRLEALFLTYGCHAEKTVSVMMPGPGLHRGTRRPGRRRRSEGGAVHLERLGGHQHDGERERVRVDGPLELLERGA